jgi:hypothetical protein
MQLLEGTKARGLGELLYEIHSWFVGANIFSVGWECHSRCMEFRQGSSSADCKQGASRYIVNTQHGSLTIQ